MPHVNKKPLARNGNLVQTKTRPRMNYECIEKTDPKNRKNKVKEKFNAAKPLAFLLQFLFRRD